MHSHRSVEHSQPYIPHDGPPALVLGSGVTALGVIRSLGRSGVPVVYADYEHDFAGLSRWAHVVRAPSLHEFTAPAELARFLDTLGFERMVLFPCSDSWARTVAALDSAVAKRFPSMVGSAEHLRVLSDKGHFARLMSHIGIPHPYTIDVDSRKVLLELTDAQLRNCFLKSRDSQRFSAHFGVKAFQAASHDEALQRFDQVRQAGLSVVLQEYIPGPATNHYFVDGYADRAGQVCARFLRQRLRMNPADFGNSTYTRSASPSSAPAAVDIVDRLIAEMGLHGIFSVELKKDERDGTFKVLEVNARPWMYVEFAAACGIDVCRMAYDEAIGVPVDPVPRYNEGVRCIHGYYDLPCCLRLYRSGHLTAGAWIRSWRGAMHTIVSADDPLPGFSYLGSLVRDAVARRLGRWSPKHPPFTEPGVAPRSAS